MKPNALLSLMILGTLATGSAFSAAAPDTQMGAVLKELKDLKGKPIETLSAAEARKQPTPTDAVKEVLENKDKSTSPMPVAKVDERSIKGADGDIEARFYTPEGDKPMPVIVYYHGGGFVIADNDVYDATPRALANATKAIVVSVEYRKAPEHKFPAAHEDAFAAYKWVVKNAKDFGGDPNRIAVAGESAGGNLAVNVSMRARDEKITMPVRELLVYPVANSDMNSKSYLENAEAKPLNKGMMNWFVKNYLNTPAEAKDPRISLVNANLKGLPPTTLITAQIDPLRSEGELLAEKLRAAGVPVSFRNYDGVTHEFFGMASVLDKAKQAQEFAAEDLKKSFTK
jgi:acetyl esterase